MTKDAIAKAPERRVRRTPVGRRDVLNVTGQDPGYHYRVVNDTGDRVQKFLDAGYEIVQAKDVQVGDRRVGAPSAPGTVAEVSVGGGVKGIVLRQKLEWYEEDQAEKAARVANIEDATKQEALDGTYGEFSIERR